jgi:hypothetical protein
MDLGQRRLPRAERRHSLESLVRPGTENPAHVSYVGGVFVRNSPASGRDCTLLMAELSVTKNRNRAVSPLGHLIPTASK